LVFTPLEVGVTAELNWNISTHQEDVNHVHVSLREFLSVSESIMEAAAPSDKNPLISKSDFPTTLRKGMCRSLHQSHVAYFEELAHPQPTVMNFTPSNLQPLLTEVNSMIANVLKTIYDPMRRMDVFTC
jgi:hypothetical protein